MFRTVSTGMVTSDAGFSVRIVDRHALEYSDTGRKLRLEIEIGLGSLSIYGSTLQAADGSGRLLVQESERMTILWRIVEAAKALGWNCTLDLSPESSDDVEPEVHERSSLPPFIHCGHGTLRHISGFLISLVNTSVTYAEPGRSTTAALSLGSPPAIDSASLAVWTTPTGSEPVAYGDRRKILQAMQEGLSELLQHEVGID